VEGGRTSAASAPLTAFGLDVYANAPVTLLGKPRARATGRELHLHVESADRNDVPWPGTVGVLSDERLPDGSVSFRIETHPEAGYLIWGPGYGHHVLSADGRRVCCCPGESIDEQWQRLLIAQVLPFATLLRGFEVFHASAVVIDGQAIAFIGPSGSGKTSVAQELCRLGADFLADDVLALEVGDGELLAHPGTPVAGVDRDEVRRPQAAQPSDRAAPASEPSQIGRRLGHEVLMAGPRELLIAMPGAEAPAPLEALFFLDRRPDGPPRPLFRPATDPRMLLSATFNFVLSTAARQRGLLEVCSLAAACRAELIEVDARTDVTHLGKAIVERAGASAQ
jgi:hypothetical protein